MRDHVAVPLLMLAVALLGHATLIAADDTGTSGPGGNNDAPAAGEADIAANAHAGSELDVAGGVIGAGPHAAVDAGGLFPDGLLMLVLIVKDEATSIEEVLRSSMPWCETYCELLLHSVSVHATENSRWCLV